MDYLVVDLEWTCDKGIRYSDSETIEIGAVLMRKAKCGFKKVDNYQALVRPKRRPVLTPFCQKLTGIDQSHVDKADVFPDVFSMFCRWCMTLTTGFENVMFCSWGFGDWKQLKKDCKYHSQSYPFRNHLDLSKLFTRKTGRKRAHRGAMKILRIEPVGGHHRGLDDAQNIVKMLPYLLGDGK